MDDIGYVLFHIWKKCQQMFMQNRKQDSKNNENKKYLFMHLSQATVSFIMLMLLFIVMIWNRLSRKAPSFVNVTLFVLFISISFPFNSLVPPRKFCVWMMVSFARNLLKYNYKTLNFNRKSILDTQRRLTICCVHFIIMFKNIILMGFLNQQHIRIHTGRKKPFDANISVQRPSRKFSTLSTANKYFYYVLMLII